MALPPNPTLADLSEADLLALRTDALIEGWPKLVATIDQMLDKRANPDLFRHSRRRKR